MKTKKSKKLFNIYMMVDADAAKIVFHLTKKKNKKIKTSYNWARE